MGLRAGAPNVTASDEKLDGFGWLFMILGVGMLANALWMLAGPMHWYYEIPAGVPDTGPFNPHFVRDIGCAFTMLGVGLAIAAVLPAWRVPALAAVTGFYLLHALVHVLDTIRGLVGHEHWMIDVPGVYAPALILLTLTVWVAKTGR